MFELWGDAEVKDQPDNGLPVKVRRWSCRQIRDSYTPRHDREGLAHKLIVIKLPRKASMLDIQAPVPQTDTGRREENSKVRE